MIERLKTENIKECVKLARLLWEDAESDELEQDFTNMLISGIGTCFLYHGDESFEKYLGFIQMSLRRDYVEGCTSSPVAYIEGIYVIDGYRRNGIAQKLIEAGEAWAKEVGCVEIASDCSLNNELSIDFHRGIGFKEANRIVCFIKGIE